MNGSEIKEDLEFEYSKDMQISPDHSRRLQTGNFKNKGLMNMESWQSMGMSSIQTMKMPEELMSNMDDAKIVDLLQNENYF